MSLSESQSGSDVRWQEVLTLGEAAAYLRVSEEQLAELADRDGVPARKVGGEWRFLRRALDDWLRYTGSPFPKPWMVPPHWLFGSPFADELLLLLEERLLRKLKQQRQPSPKPGSKEAVLKHVGVFHGDNDLKDRLADARARRAEERK
jgi:excisionase family DNA binding protein